MIQYAKRTVLLANIILCLILALNLLGDVRRMSTKELVKESTAVVAGQCIGKHCYWDEDRTKIFTKITIRAQEYVKGNLGSEIELTIPGGRVGNILYEVSDMPLIDEGEEVFLFIWQHPSGKNLITGAFQGKYQIIRDKKTGEKIVPGIHEEMDQKKPAQPFSVPMQRQSNVLLKDFIQRVKLYVLE